ncbi:unnamed protein product, partial [Enterobius vermicularis]|uniref:DUF19 domain-containing protein n=1 Tax=Enterobius vermicularis TaxID=51028 RepID=A0A0N4VM83_ENTVE
NLYGIFFHKEFCENYVHCAKKLEQKQRECLELQIKRSTHLKNNCSNLSQPYRALELRKTELYRDCVQERMADFPTNMDTEHQACARMSKKYVSSSSKMSKRQQKRLSRRKKNQKNRELKECRMNAKLWHKHCRRLAKCCPVYNQLVHHKLTSF